jgi:hypothetical protein
MDRLSNLRMAILTNRGTRQRAAGDTLRDRAVAFYAKAMAIRYNKSNTSSVVSKAAASQPPPIAD